MYEIPDRPSSTTPVAEAFEQLSGTVLDCLDRIAGVIQEDLDRAASGSLRLEDLASCGPRLVRAGLANLYDLAAAWSDNLSLLRSTPLAPGEAAVVKTTVPVDVPANHAVRIVASSLTRGGGAVASTGRLTFTPSACVQQGADRRERIGVTLRSAGLRGGVYTGVLCVCAAEDGATLHDVTFHLPVSDLD